MVRAVVAVLVLALVAGCFANGDDSAGSQPTGPTEGVQEPTSFLDLQGCSEINFFVPRADDPPELPPFMVAPRTADRVTTALITIFSCSGGTTSLQDVEEAAAYTYLFPVDELDFLNLPGSAGYLFLTNVRTADVTIAATFAQWAQVEEVSALEVSFEDVGGMRKGRANAVVVSSSAGSTQYQSAMLQPGAAGEGGFLGMYTVNETHVHLHNVTFGDYFGYSVGSGAVTNPRATERGATQAYHNIDYDVRFDFGVDEAPRP